MKVYKTAVSSMAFLLLRIFKGVKYPEEIFYELEIFLKSLEKGTILEIETFFKALEKEFTEGSYNLTEKNIRKDLRELSCPSFVEECVVSTIMGVER